MKEINESKIGINPFVEDLVIVTVGGKSKEYTLDKVEGGMMLNQLYYGKEKHDYTKLYTTTDIRLLLGSLKPSSSHVLLWIQQTIDYTKDYVFIDRDRASKELNLSLNTLKISIESLVDNNIIYPTRIQSVYFINPNYFFKGDRIKKYPHKVVQYKVTKYILDNNDEVVKEGVDIVTINGVQINPNDSLSKVGIKNIYPLS